LFTSLEAPVFKVSSHPVFIVIKRQLFRPGNLLGSSKLETLAAQLIAVKLTPHLCIVALRKNLRAHQDIWYVDLQHDVYSDCLKAVYDSLPALLGK